MQSFEDIDLHAPVPPENEMPSAVFTVYRYVIAINHFKDELHLFQHSYLQNGEPEPDDATTTSRLNDISDLITGRNYPTYSFSVAGPEASNFTDDEFRGVIQRGKDHCQRGDVFQIVLSRRFQTPFSGDEF